MKKALKIAGISAGSILCLLFLLALTPTLFKQKFGQVVKQTINKELKTELDFSGLEISFFRHFPNLTVTLSDALLKSSPPFSGDTLVSARELSFAVNLASLFRGPIRVGKVYVIRGKVVVQYNEKGASNFDVLRSTGEESPSEVDSAAAGSASIRIEQIAFIKTDFI
jgi:AsmA protein